MTHTSAYVSALDLFSIGIGPSSSHTVGPMRAAHVFVDRLEADGLLSAVRTIAVVLHGSLAATGVGHGTPDAVVAGLTGLDPRTCDPDLIPGGWARLGDGADLTVRGHALRMGQADLRLAPLTLLPRHPNGMRFTARGRPGEAPVAEEVYYSIGGGFIRRDGAGDDGVDREDGVDGRRPAGGTTGSGPTRGGRGPEVPFEFASMADLLGYCDRERGSIAGIAWANETALRPAEEVRAGLDGVWQTMSACVDAGLLRTGVLPGGLGVHRRAADVRRRLDLLDERGEDTSIEWLQAFAMAVSEENAAGRRVVTAPTNGAAGIIPAVGRHYLRTRPDIAGDPARRAAAMRTYLLTAAAIGSLFKRNASISGAEAGCQGEVGSACSMAAAGICALLGGTPDQVENAAEIAMEHNLGLTCDPVAGLVQVPCIERNAIAACTAVAAARLARQGDGAHVVSLDTVIETMRQTGVDMSGKYKETSTGGLAVNVVNC